MYVCARMPIDYDWCPSHREVLLYSRGGRGGNPLPQKLGKRPEGFSQLTEEVSFRIVLGFGLHSLQVTFSPPTGSFLQAYCRVTDLPLPPLAPFIVGPFLPPSLPSPFETNKTEQTSSGKLKINLFSLASVFKQKHQQQQQQQHCQVVEMGKF